MKTLIILLLALLPCIAFSQAMNLPGAADLTKTPPDNGKKNTKGNAALLLNKVDTTTNVGSGTASAPHRFNAAVLSTNFTIPLVRVNFLNSKVSGSNALVSTSFLNAAGAGLNYSWGEIDQTVDKTGSIASTSFINRFGFQLGFLFAANTASGSTATTTATTTTTSTQSTAVFAIMGGISILNIQIGGGYEFGTLATGQKRGFMTIAYAIPISTLVNGGYKICHSSPITANTP